MPKVTFRSTHLSWTQFAEYERLAWFLFESFERERRLNLNALYATPPSAAMALMSAVHPFFVIPLACLAIPAKNGPEERDHAAAPPSMLSETPVMKLASELARKATAAAISSGRP